MARTFIVTGATGTIGKEIVKGIARTGAQVVLACRRLDVGEITASEIAKEADIPREKLKVMQVDLSVQSSIKQFADAFKAEHTHLHGLVNNAALNQPGGKKLSEDGIELTWATNVMSYFLLTNLLLDTLKASAPSRIVNVASNYAGDLDLNDVQLERRRFSINTAYRQSKQADRMLAWAFDEKLRGSGVTINACHPGVATSALLKSLGMSSGWESAQKSAATPVFLAASPKVEGISGRYFNELHETPCQFRDLEACKQLLEVCSKLVKI